MLLMHEEWSDGLSIKFSMRCLQEDLFDSQAQIKCETRLGLKAFICLALIIWVGTVEETKISIKFDA